MRKTEYDSYVEVYMTCEERCGLWRIMKQIEACVIPGDNKSYIDINVMRSVDIKDIKVLHDLVYFAHDNTPGEACKSIEVTFDILRAQHIKRVK